MPPMDPNSPSNQLLLRVFQCLSLCNCCLVMVLGVVVVVLFGQVELLSAKVSEDRAAVENLKIQVQEKQQGQIQQLNEAVQEEHNLTVTVLAGVFTLLTCLISMFHMTSHLQRYNAPSVQRKIVAILWMSPIYSVTSFASLIWPAAEGYLAIIKDCYEAYCIYTFLSFLIAVLSKGGGRETAVQVVAKHAGHLAKPTRWLRNWYHPPPEQSDEAKANAVLTECQILAIQFVLIRPLTSIASFMIAELDKEQESHHHHTATTVTTSGEFTNATEFDSSLSPNATVIVANSTTVMDKDDISQATVAYFTSPGFFIAMITNLSVFFAFTGLLKFYHAVHNDLQWCNPWPKFLTIKGVVFLTFWQGLVISIVVHFNHRDDSGRRSEDTLLMDDTTPDDPIDPSERAAQLQNILVCLEMLLFSITHWCVFPADEWDSDRAKRRKFAAKPGIGIRDLVSDVNQLYHQSRNRSRTLSKNSKRDMQQHGDDAAAATASARRKYRGQGPLYDYHSGGDAKDFQQSSSSYDDDDDDDDIYGLERPGSNDVDETVIVFPQDSTATLGRSDSQDPDDSLKIV